MGGDHFGDHGDHGSGPVLFRDMMCSRLLVRTTPPFLSLFFACMVLAEKNLAIVGSFACRDSVIL